jgi:hypothetical protein
MRPAASMYALVRSVLAPCVTESPAWFVPVIVAVPKPVSLGVGNVPTSPVITVGPVLVIPAPARTAKLSAVPRATGGCAAAALSATTSITNSASSGSPTRLTGPAAKRRCDVTAVLLTNTWFVSPQWPRHLPIPNGDHDCQLSWSALLRRVSSLLGGLGIHSAPAFRANRPPLPAESSNSGASSDQVGRGFGSTRTIPLSWSD